MELLVASTVTWTLQGSCDVLTVTTDGCRMKVAVSDLAFMENLM